MIGNVWSHWNESAVIMNYAEMAQISTIPFPTIFVCPWMQTLKSKLDLSSRMHVYLRLPLPVPIPIENLTETE